MSVQEYRLQDKIRIYALARETKAPLLLIGLSVAAGLGVSHNLLPPHPGAMLALATLGGDVGKTILYGTLVGLPAAIVGGPVFGREQLGSITGVRARAGATRLA